jgi:EAL domain-containing protein (putative c-di-GMP-specific phosphodiesterase class I)
MSVPGKILRRLAAHLTEESESEAPLSTEPCQSFAPAQIVDAPSKSLDRLPSTHGTQALEKRNLEADLITAIRERQFVLHYQPQLDLRTGEILSVEALIRWNRPGVGIVLPAQFIPFAEQQGLIGDIGDWTMATAADEVAEWDRSGLPPFGMAVNVSVAEFHQADFADRLASMLRSKRVAANRMELEITEAVIMRDNEATIGILQRLRDLGIALSIDDFGTGFSSLGYLRRFPLDEIKIDRTFVHEMTKDESAAGVVRGIIELAHSLKLQAIAEGVETTEQIKRLMDLKCDRAQGYLITRPIPSAKLHCFLEEWPKRWMTMTA